MLQLTSDALLSNACSISFNSEGTKPRIIIAHGMQCDIGFARLLSTALGPDYPICGLQGLGLDGTQVPLDTIEAIAAEFIRCSIHDHGPAYLAGFCAGGHIALEMAHQLGQYGINVASVFLIDTPPSVDPEQLSTAIQEAVAVATRRRVANPEAARNFPGGAATVAAFGRALQRYRPRSYAGSAHILANAERLPIMRDPEVGWPKLLRPDTPLTVIAPNHDAIAQSHIRRVANYIRERVF